MTNDLPWEDSLLERKLESDKKDFLKTFVAFANSVRPGHTAVVLIGEKEDGTVQGVSDADELQKKVRKICEGVYPDIIWRSRVYEKDGCPCVRVEIEYSGDTPHFGGVAWIRRGSESVKASDEVFQQLINLRSSKVRELSKWLNKEVIVMCDLDTVSFEERFKTGPPRWPGERKATLVFVNKFWATFMVANQHITEPLEKLVLSWDFEAKCLKILVKVQGSAVADPSA